MRARTHSVSDFQQDFEVRGGVGRLLTVPDCAWPDLKVPVFCGGYAQYGNPHTLALNKRKRNQLQFMGWIVLTFLGPNYSGQTLLRLLKSAAGSRNTPQTSRPPPAIAMYILYDAAT